MEDFRLNPNSDWDKFKHANPSIVSIYNTIVKDQLLSYDKPTPLDSIVDTLRYHYNYSNEDVSAFMKFVQNEEIVNVTFGEPYHNVRNDSLYFRRALPGPTTTPTATPTAVATPVPLIAAHSKYPRDKQQ